MCTQFSFGYVAENEVLFKMNFVPAYAPTFWDMLTDHGSHSQKEEKEKNIYIVAPKVHLLNLG